MEHRIVSLIASATEIVAALGYQDSLVGRSHECDYPPSVLDLAVCSEPRINVNTTSGEIDRQVKQTVREVLSVYSVFHEVLDSLQPTLIITQSQCDVCAVNLRDVRAAVAEMVSTKPDVVSLEPMSLADIWTDTARVAEAIDDIDAGEQLIGSLQTRLQNLKRKVLPCTSQPTIFCMEWLDPLMSAGNWIPELVELAGGIPVLCESGKHSPYVTWDHLVTADPDVIAIMPCGFDIDRSMQEIHLLTDHPAWSTLKAVRQNRVYVTDGNQFFNRPGPRVVESAEILFEILNEPLSETSHAGSGWMKLS